MWRLPWLRKQEHIEQDEWIKRHNKIIEDYAAAQGISEARAYGILNTCMTLEDKNYINRKCQPNEMYPLQSNDVISNWHPY